jgi:hypothetical protein
MMARASSQVCNLTAKECEKRSFPVRFLYTYKAWVNVDLKLADRGFAMGDVRE